ncbi:MAG TPA: hypothetical protein VKA48_01495 [Gammaproteobacteria bacterium]|nr:hypothetical protein [Gammaproteobacteria bacterium]
MHGFPQRWISGLFGAAALALLAVALPPQGQALAAGNSGGGSSGSDSGDLKAQLKETQQRVQKLRRRIASIQHKAKMANPDLRKEQEKLKDLLKKHMRSHGVQPEDTLAKMRKIHKKMEKAKGSAAKSLHQRYGRLSHSFRQAQSQAIKDPEVKKARDTFRGHMLAAMKKIEPDSEHLTQALQKAHDRFQALIRKNFAPASASADD